MEERTVSIRSDLRAEAMLRDIGCRWPTFEPANYHEGPLEMCHIVQSSQGGPDTLENVVMLCKRHHDILDNRVAKGRRAAILDVVRGFLMFKVGY